MPGQLPVARAVQLGTDLYRDRRLRRDVCARLDRRRGRPHAWLRREGEAVVGGGERMKPQAVGREPTVVVERMATSSSRRAEPYGAESSSARGVATRSPGRVSMRVSADAPIAGG
jgi:hypothetical protein